jgi:hypothetical protein
MANDSGKRRVDLDIPENTAYPPTETAFKADLLQPLLERIPLEAGRWVSCDPGWFSLLSELDKAIAALRPDYRLLRVQGRAGELLYYIDWESIPEEILAEIGSTLESYRELARRTCEVTGEPGMQLERNGWVKTLRYDFMEHGWVPAAAGS